MRPLVSALLAAVALAGCATTPAPRTADLQVAITIDDLPHHGEMPPGETPVRVAWDVVAALKRAGVTNAYGFINGHWTEEGADYAKVLAAWDSAELPLANHGWSHRHLSEMTLAEFEQELASNEPLLEMIEAGEDWRWFRYPFLDEGESAEKRIGSRQILVRRGYRIADVTMDTNDWQWTAPYARCTAAGDEAAVAWLEQSYLHSLGETMRYYRSLSHGVYGRDIPYVLLLHISAFEARMLPRLLALFRDQGFEFVSLEEAQSDPAYMSSNNPALPPEPKALEGKAAAEGIPLPPRTSYAATLEAICRPAATSAQ